MAALSWMASGIYQKMENDITTMPSQQNYFKNATYRGKIALRNDAQLTMEYIFPSFILLGVGLVPAMVAFFLEQLYHLYEKRDTNKTSHSSHRHISKGPVQNDDTRSTERIEEVEMQVTF